MGTSIRTAKPQPAAESGFTYATEAVALFMIAEGFPHRQFTITELAILSGLGGTAVAQIKNAPDSPFSMGKCSMRRLDAWLARHTP
jgi:hypothetical protein